MRNAEKLRHDLERLALEEEKIQKRVASHRASLVRLRPVLDDIRAEAQKKLNELEGHHGTTENARGLQNGTAAMPVDWVPASLADLERPNR